VMLGDLLSIALGLAAFAVLYALIWGLDDV
jgi:hypothetical protein